MPRPKKHHPTTFVAQSQDGCDLTLRGIGELCRRVQGVVGPPEHCRRIRKSRDPNAPCMLFASRNGLGVAGMDSTIPVPWGPKKDQRVSHREKILSKAQKGLKLVLPCSRGFVAGIAVHLYRNYLHQDESQTSETTDWLTIIRQRDGRSSLQPWGADTEGSPSKAKHGQTQGRLTRQYVPECHTHSQITIFIIYNIYIFIHTYSYYI